MKLWIAIVCLLLTSCTSPSSKSEAITTFAPCSSIQTKGMSTDGVFLECLDGEGQVAIGSIEGPAVISAWASWCTNCEAQRPYLIELYEKSSGKLQVIGVDVEEKSKKDGYEHALKKGMAYPHLFDPDGRTSENFGPGVPITQFINAEGTLWSDPI